MCVCGGVQLLEPVRKPLTIRPAFEVSGFAEGDSGDVQICSWNPSQDSGPMLGLVSFALNYCVCLFV